MAGNSDEHEQLDEVEFLEAMSKEGEFDWSRGDHGNISGTLNIFPQLESPIKIYLMRREKISCRPSLAKDDRKSNTLMEASASGAFGDRVRTPDVAADKFKGAAEVLHLPPICLQFQLPPDYPSRGMPGFTLSCKWLNFSQVRGHAQTVFGHFDITSRPPPSLSVNIISTAALSVMGLTPPP